ncbi:MAG: hypothetical protein N3A69_13990 [Leptospiraceae bacterium]|nr:hypothetical protein [Leptospiraceae bacterium]
MLAIIGVMAFASGPSVASQSEEIESTQAQVQGKQVEVLPRVPFVRETVDLLERLEPLFNTMEGITYLGVGVCNAGTGTSKKGDKNLRELGGVACIEVGFSKSKYVAAFRHLFPTKTKVGNVFIYAFVSSPIGPE